MSFLKGKKILVTGLASNKSIAYGIVKSLKEYGAEIALTYLNDKLKGRVEDFAKEFGVEVVLPLDVSTDENIKECFTALSEKWDKFDGFVHAIAFATGDQLDGDYVNASTREGYRIAHDISAYSFVAMAREARPYLNEGASLVTLTYLGAERAIPNYNVMSLAKASLEAATRVMALDLGKQGIRVNAISAGPIRTLAASGIKNFRKMLAVFENSAALKRTITIEDVGKSAAFLCSDLSSGVTGEVLHVDAGFSITAMAELEE